MCQQNEMFSHTTVVLTESVCGSTKSRLDGASAWNDAPMLHAYSSYLFNWYNFYENFICFAELYANTIVICLSYRVA